MPSPAAVSTITRWPLWTSSRTLAGTSPTRYSCVLISLGTPTSISGDLFQHVSQDAEDLVDVALLQDQRRRERDDVARGADQQALVVGAQEGVEGACGR